MPDSRRHQTAALFKQDSTGSRLGQRFTNSGRSLPDRRRRNFSRGEAGAKRHGLSQLRQEFFPGSGQEPTIRTPALPHIVMAVRPCRSRHSRNGSLRSTAIASPIRARIESHRRALHVFVAADVYNGHPRGMRSTGARATASSRARRMCAAAEYCSTFSVRLTTVGGDPAKTVTGCRTDAAEARQDGRVRDATILLISLARFRRRAETNPSPSRGRLCVH